MDLPEFWGLLPDSIHNLYQQVHDGFLTNLWAGSAGLIQSRELRRLNDSFGQGLLHHSVRGPSDLLYYVRDEQGKEVRDSAGEAIDPDPLPDPDALIAVCKNHGTARLLIDTTSTDESHAWELWEYNVEYWPNLWARLDHWLVQTFITDGYQPPPD